MQAGCLTDVSAQQMILGPVVGDPARGRRLAGGGGRGGGAPGRVARLPGRCPVPGWPPRQAHGRLLPRPPPPRGTTCFSTSKPPAATTPPNGGPTPPPAVACSPAAQTA